MFNFLGIKFIENGYQGVMDKLADGGLIVAPAAPALVEIDNDPEYYKALKGSDIAIPDSSFMVLLFRIFKNIKLKRLSGLKFLRLFLEEDFLRESDSDLFLIDPTSAESDANYDYLIKQGIPVNRCNQYLAPMYPRIGLIEDPKLLEIVKQRRPKYIIINLGGGIQEKLGFYLISNLEYKPLIVSTGSAIAFLTGCQVNIPVWIDALYLGWLWRCASNPKVYVKRYLKGFKLVPIFFREVF